MSNIAAVLDSESARFIDEFSALQVPWGMPSATGRLYGFLMLSPSPVSLDEIVEALGIAKSSASVITRALEQAGVVRRYAEAGSKRVRYAAAEDAAGLFAAKMTLLDAVVRMLKGAAEADMPPTVSARLHRHAQFYARMRTSIEDMLRDEHSTPQR